MEGAGYYAGICRRFRGSARAAFVCASDADLTTGTDQRHGGGRIGARDFRAVSLLRPVVLDAGSDILMFEFEPNQSGRQPTRAKFGYRRNHSLHLRIPSFYRADLDASASAGLSATAVPLGRRLRWVRQRCHQGRERPEPGVTSADCVRIGIQLASVPKQNAITNHV